MPLGEVCIFKRGKTISEKDTIPGDVPVIAGGKKPAYYHNQANRTGETIAVSSSGAYAGYISYWTIPVFLSDSFSVSPNDTLKTKYLYYFLTSIQNNIFNLKKGGGVPHIHSSDIENFKIPVPSLAEQERIVGILDKFDALVNDISIGLPAEIDGRRKQYEYYRNKLLTFPQVV